MTSTFVEFATVNEMKTFQRSVANGERLEIHCGDRESILENFFNYRLNLSFGDLLK
jgi:hypothetical protein